MKASIIIPVYNASAFIADCIASISLQSEEDWEAIFVDDGSSDDSADKILQHRDSRIHLISQKNAGPSSARNHGVREAKGEYIFFLDADDQITPYCIETLYRIAKIYDADYVQGAYRGEDTNVNDLFLNNKKDIKALLLDYTRIPFTPHNRFVRRQFILDHNLFFDERINVREDFLWMTFVAKYVNRLAVSTVETYIRGYNSESLTHSINREREILGYRVLIETMCANFDPFLKGTQKKLAVDALLMALRFGYYNNEKERQYLIKTVNRCNNILEKLYLKLYLSCPFSIVLHQLNWIYKIEDSVAEFVRFVAVGILCTGIDVGLFYIIRSVAPFFLAMVSSYILSLSVNYYLTVRWTFHVRSTLSKGVSIVFAHLFNLFVVRMSLMFFFVSIFCLPDRVAFVPTLVISVITNYAIIKYLIKR